MGSNGNIVAGWMDGETRTSPLSNFEATGIRIWRSMDWAKDRLEEIRPGCQNVSEIYYDDDLQQLSTMKGRSPTGYSRSFTNERYGFICQKDGRWSHELNK
jgi:hypothetical protein